MTRRAYWPAWMILGVALPCTVLAWFVAHREIADDGRRRFEAEARRIAVKIEDRLRSDEQALRGTLSLLAASERIDRDQWRSYVAMLAAGGGSPGLERMGYAELVPAAGKAAHVAERKDEGFADYRILPEGDRPLYAVVLYSEPSGEDTGPGFGFDLLSDPATAETMETARDSGGASMARTPARTDAAAPASYLIYLPVYLGDRPPTSLDARRNNLSGFVFAALRMDELLRSIPEVGAGRLRLRLFDGATPTGAPIFSTPAVGGEETAYSFLLPFQYGGHGWTLRFEATPAFFAPLGRHVPTLVAVGGVAIGLLLFLVAWSAANSQEQLRLRDAQLGYLFEKNPGAMLVFDRASLAILEANEAAAQLYGLSRNDLLRLRLPDLRADRETAIDPEDGRQALEHWHREWRHRIKDGRIADVAMTAHRLQFRGRDAMLALARNVTETNRARAALMESERYFHSMANLMPAFVWLDDPDGKVVFINRPWLEYTGRTLEEQLGDGWTSVIHPDDLDRIWQEMEETYRLRQPFVLQYRIRGQDGEYRWYADRGRPRIAEDDTLLGYIGVVLDITELREAQAQLQQAAKMDAVSRLGGGIAHDFNNLLSIIIGNADLLVDKLDEGDKLRSRATTIVSAAMRAAELTSRVLAFSRRQPLQSRAIDVNELVAGFRSMLERSISEDVELEIVLGKGLWPATADPDRLESAILNLTINAQDAMPDGGKLAIETSNVAQQGPDALLRADGRPTDAIVIAVRDNGTGMAPALLERVFEPFFTTKEVGKGTGLGLPTVYGFTKQSGGDVRIESEVGRGTTVRIYLPRASAEGEPVAIREISPAVGEVPGGTETILVVEDDAMLRANVERQLGDLGYKVVTAETGPHALARLDEIGEIDLLFTDVIMPGGMNGRQLADAARKLRPEIAVLFTTGYANTAFAKDGSRDPDLKVLNKPYRRAALARKVREALDERNGAAV